MRADVAALLSAAEAFVMGSCWEGMPLAVQEAASTGLPVVATNAGGIPALVEHGHTGLLSPCGDVRSLSQHMLRLMALPARARRRMGREGRRFMIERYSIEQVVVRTEGLYERVLTSRWGHHTVI